MIYEDLKIITDQLLEPHVFEYYDSENANVFGDEIEQGNFYIVLDAPTRTSGAMRKNGTFGENLNVRIYFLNNYTEKLGGHSTELDDNSVQLNAIQKDCYDLAKKFIIKFIYNFPYADRSNGSLSKINFSFESVQYVMNSNFHGVVMTCSLPVNLPFNYCLGV